MLNLLSERQRRHSLSSKHKKSSVLNQINLNMLQVYLPEKKVKNSNAGSRVKGKDIKNRKGQQIKQFALIEGIKFKSNPRQLEHKVMESQVKQKLSFKQLQSHDKNANREKMNIGVQKQQIQRISGRKRQNLHSSQPLEQRKSQSYFNRYKQAIQKIFQGLDIFNRGTITETNINKWIPEEALYFLGRVFQKIRQERLYLSSDQFLKECLPILYESSEEDVQSFLEEVNGKETMHNVSIDFPSEEKNVNESLVQLKITKDSSMDAQRNIPNKSPALQQYQRSKYKPLVPCQDLVGKIKEKENYLNQRLNSIKQKKNTAFLSYKQCTSISASQKKYQSSNYVSKQKIIGKEKVETIKVSNFQSNKYKQFERKKKKEEDVQPYIEKNEFNFSFQLKQINKDEPSKIKNILQIRKNQIPVLKKQMKFQLGELTFQKIERNMIPLRTSRIVRQNLKPKQFISSQKKSNANEQDTERIDKLSSRLEEYIKYNKQKIEKNKKFIRQNSAPKS